MCYGHAGERVLDIPEVPSGAIDVEDHSLADWAAAGIEPTFTSLELRKIEDFEAPGILGVPDLDLRVYLGWSRRPRLYVAIHRIDNVHIGGQIDSASVFSGFHRNDGTQIIIDGDHSAHTAPFEPECWPAALFEGGSNRIAQQYLVAPTEVGGQGRIIFAGTQNGWLLQEPYTSISGWSTDPQTYFTEFYLTPFDDINYRYPVESTVSAWGDGDIIGLYLGFSDFDDRSGEYNGYWNLTGRPGYCFEHRLPDFRLVSFAATLLERLTWGQTKGRHSPSSNGE